MASKSPNIRDHIPSVSDLLENPSIRVLAERWSRNAVVSGVRSFLDELRNDLTRRDSESSWPSLRELAERAARHIAASQQTSEQPAINATGRFWAPTWASRPQCDAALERGVGFGREFVARPQVGTATAGGDAEAIVCRITGAAAATVVHSYAGGLWLALAAVAQNREVIVSRAELGEVEPGCAAACLVASAGAKLREVGAINRTQASDYQSAITPQTAALLTICQESFVVSGETVAPTLADVVTVSRERDLVVIDALGSASLVDLPAELRWPDRSARASLLAGSQLVLLRGDGLVGGPPCGILAGECALIEKITSHPLFAAFKLDSQRAAALAATLECHAERPGAESGVPLLELLTTPLENLHHRAERLAAQLALADGIRTADVVSMMSPCDGLPMSRRSVRSFGVALTPAIGDVSSLERRLAAAAMPVFGRVDGDRVLLDLRTVLPRHDQSIVRAMVGPSPVAANSAGAQSTATGL